jgi:hypothetical protein
MRDPNTRSQPAPRPATEPDREARLPDREARLAEALRSNLHRRKAQARARRDSGPPPKDPADHEG